MMNTRLDAIIFDLDGTLGDTLPVCYAAFRAALLEFLGRNYTDAEIRRMFGPSEEGVIRRLVPEHQQEACLQSFLAAYEREHQQRATTFPGIDGALRLLKERGLRRAIVTGKGPHSAAISLRHLGLAPYFDVVEAGSPEGGVKPQAIRRVLERWGIPPERAAYVGDVPSDVHGAREAGVLPLAAAWAESADVPALEASQPHALFLTVDSFIRWIAEL